MVNFSFSMSSMLFTIPMIGISFRLGMLTFTMILFLRGLSLLILIIQKMFGKSIFETLIKISLIIFILRIFDYAFYMKFVILKLALIYNILFSIIAFATFLHSSLYELSILNVTIMIFFNAFMLFK